MFRKKEKKVLKGVHGEEMRVKDRDLTLLSFKLPLRRDQTPLLQPPWYMHIY